MGRRCSECRKSFEAARSAAATQRVCGLVCRAKRERKFARTRRRVDLDDARAAERHRQRTSRVRRTATSGCHAVASERKVSESRDEVKRSVDRALARSRGSLAGELNEIVWQLAQTLAKPGGCHAGA